MPEADQRGSALALRFLTGATLDTPLHLRGFVGREQLSALFEYELLLTSDERLSDEQVDDVLHAPCAIQIGEAEEAVHGLLADVKVLDAGRDGEPRYLARLVPTLWLLTLTRTNRIYEQLNIAQLSETILDRYQFRSPDDYRVLQLRSGDPREYIVQYDESDWSFVQRWLEDEGLFYWFEHTHDRDVLVVSDRNEEATPLEQRLAYRGRNDLPTPGEATVWDFDESHRRLPGRVVVQDYNYRHPEYRLVVKEDVDAKRGFGTAFYYNDHFQTEEEGEEVAKLRAEQLRSERRIYTGCTDCARLHVGYWFELSDHPAEELNQRYLITEVEHRAGCDLDAPRDGPLDTGQGYRVTFRAVPMKTAYRPPRRTEWPSIEGIMHGHITAEGDGKYAQMDEYGRYRVVLPFDRLGTQSGKVSRWIRMAQPYAGAGHGSHHPLRKGTEVLIAHIDGDPDRPIIVGSVPNAQTPSPTTSRNATQSVIQTASGIRIEMEDLQE